MKKLSTRKISVYFIVILLVLCGTLGILYTRRTVEPIQKTTIAMGSVASYTVYDRNTDTAQAAADESATAIAALENQISCKLPNSEISAVNQSNGSVVTVSANTAELLRLALQLQERTDNRYNICTLPLTVLWDFDAENFTVPSADALQDACAAIAATTCEVSGNAVQLLPDGAGIDLGSVGKGAACDTAVAIYRAQGCTAGIVTVGGSIGLYGEKPDGSAWRIGIRDPAGNASAQLGTLTLSTGFLSTSGTYEKTREADGISYHHLLDPSNGLPAETDLISATVVCDNGALSDILATSCVLLGRKDGAALLAEYNAEYVLIGTDHTIYVSDGLRASFTLSNNDYLIH